MLNFEHYEKNGRKYYNGNRLRSHTDSDVWISVGGRGIGKTYDWKKYFIRRYLKGKGQWTYCMRYPNNIKNPDLLLDDVKKDFPKYEMKCEGKRMYIRRRGDKKWQVMGLVIAMSKAGDFKGTSYENMTGFLFDEFQIDNDDRRLARYLKNEVITFSNLVESLFRTRDFKIVLLSNAITISNPYFEVWRINPRADKITNYTKIYNINGQRVKFKVTLEMVNSDEFTDRYETKTAKIAISTGLSDSSLMNNFKNDNKTFIEKTPKKSRFMFSIVRNGTEVGIWYKNSKLYATTKRRNTNRRYTTKEKEANESLRYVKSYNDYEDLVILKTYAMAQKIRFESVHIKNALTQFLYDLHIY